MIEKDILESIAGHEVRNAALLEDIRSRGLNPDRPQAVEHHFWAPTQQSAVQLAKKLYELEYVILVLSPVDDDHGTKVWNVEAGVQRTLAEAASSAMSEQLIRLAAQFDAVYDGWGASI